MKKIDFKKLKAGELVQKQGEDVVELVTPLQVQTLNYRSKNTLI